jgi:signal transduction histidine kinase
MVQYDRTDLANGRVRWTDLTPAEWRDRDELGVAELKATGVLQPYEKEYVRKDGSRVPVLLGGALFAGSGNEGVAFVLDLTSQKRSEEALGQARSELAHVARVASLGVLTASIAHEVNQPLSGIITNASTCLRMLDAAPPNVEGARKTVQRTMRDANRASEVILRLRALFGNRQTTTESVDLNEATREVIALSLRELQRNQVTVRLDLTPDLPRVQGDRVQLQQVILNLLLNASESMREVDDRPREVIIRTAPDEGEHVRLAVRDTGEGFQHGVDKVFEIFYSTKSGGMGIGLSVSRSIIERHHGRLWATSNDGPGATFAFSMPHTAEREADAARTP